MRLIIAFIGLLITQSLFGQTLDLEAAHKDIWAAEQKAHKNKLYKTSGVQALNNYNIVYHRCNWQVDPAIDSIHGDIKTLFIPQEAGFNKLEFDLTKSMQVDSVLYHGSSIPFIHTASDILEITFPQNIAVNTLDSVTVIYQGQPISTGFGSWEQAIHAGTPLIWTLSEPYGAKDWWPCKQNLLDKIDSIDIVVTTPSAYRVASNGLLTSEVTIGQQKRFEWRHRHPIAAYLVAIAITNYAQYSDFAHTPNGTIEILNYVFPEDSASLLSQTFETVKMIELFDSLFIPYPYADEKYGHAQFMWPGAMEHQTMSFMGSFHWGIASHELAHQWFGDHVTCGSWEDIWLNEGFASYLEGIYIEHEKPSLWQIWKQSTIDAITSKPDGSVLCDDTTKVYRIFSGRLSYQKGSYLVHMLRWQVGDSAFYAGLRNYLNDPFLQAGFARTDDLKYHLEQASGQNLNTFFDQWYYKQGHPTYNVSWSQDTSSVWLMVNQSQSHISVPFFTMPIPIRFYGTGQDTTIVFDHAFSGQQYAAEIDFKINSVVFDPDLWILSANNTAAIGISENTASMPIIYPNPASKSIILRGFTNAEELSILDLTGRLLYKQSVAPNQTKAELDVSNFSIGSYILLLKTANGNQSFRFLVQ